MSIDKITQTLQRIKNDKSLEDHFFKKLAVASKPLEWLIPLRDAGYFDSIKNPRPQEVPNKKGYFTVPHWNVLDAIENMAIKNEENPDAEVAAILREIVDGIINFRKNGERINNYRTDWKLLVIISHFPIEYIGNQHIRFINESLHSSMGTSLLDHELGNLFIPKLVREKAKELIIELLDVILHYRKTEATGSREYISVIDPYYLKEALDKNKQGISDVCDIEAANVAIAKIRAILKEDGSQFNFVWIPTIEDHEQTHFADRYECMLVHFVRDMFEAADPRKIVNIVQEMVDDEHDIFKRLAYHIINHHYDALSHLFWSVSCNPLNSLTIHELYELIKGHCKSFNEEQIGIVLKWIEAKDYYFSDEVSGNAEKEEHIKAYYKKEWLLALLDAGNEEVKRRYEAYNSINNATIEHPGFHYWSSGSGWVQDVSPIDEVEFKEKTNDEIAEYINAYSGKDDISLKDFTRISLSASVRKFVSDDPVRFSVNMAPFLSVPRKYQYEFLRGFEEAWRNNKDFSWDELLPFMKQLIEPASFWIEEGKEGRDNYSRWIADAIANLIWEGTKDDKHAFSPNLLPIAEQVILLLLENVKSPMHMMSDLLMSVLNSSKGRVYIAAINYSLRHARLYGQSKEKKWIESIRAAFMERLDRTKETGIEFSVVVGWYLPYLYYLDKQWVIENVNRIFDINSEEYWQAAFTGYIVMTSTVYEEIYKLIRDNGHYEKGLSSSLSDKQATDKLVQHLTIGYLAGWDDLEDANGLLNKLLASGNPKYISGIVSFMWMFKDKPDENLRRKIKPLWKAIVEKVAPNIEKVEYRLIASNLGRWLSLVDTIDEDVSEWLEISVSAIEENWNSGFFIEYLHRHVMKTPSVVGNLYLTMLNYGAYPDYKKEDIVAIVQALYDLKAKDTAEIANRICNLYHLKGFEFLRETFNRNN